MRTTDRSARHCRECDAPLDAETVARNRRAGMNFCDACLATLPRAVREGWIIAHPKLTPTEIGIGRAIARRVEQQRRAEKRARRLAIARRRQRIAEQPRVGDALLFDDHWCWDVVRCTVTGVVIARDPAGYPKRLTADEWREEVRRAQMTQEGSEQ